jgi:transposase
MIFDELNNDEWACLAALLGDQSVGLHRRGRPRAKPRTVANAVLWVLTTGESWSRLPGRYPSSPTCRHRFEEWLLDGTLAQMTRVLSEFGRTFAVVPQALEVPVRRPAPVSGPSVERPRGVFWKSSESWQRPVACTSVNYPADVLSATLRQLCGPVDRIPGASPSPLRTGGPEPGRLECQNHIVWIHRACDSTRVEEYRRCTVYASAQPVPNQMFRACVEIVKDGRRIKRSGLIGPRFADSGAAEHHALEWACQWIDREFATRVHVGADRSAATRCAVSS